jgi:hypothetical protein
MFWKSKFLRRDFGTRNSRVCSMTRDPGRTTVTLFSVSVVRFIVRVQLYGLYVLAECCAGGYSHDLNLE